MRFLVMALIAVGLGALMACGSTHDNVSARPTFIYGCIQCHG